MSASRRAELLINQSYMKRGPKLPSSLMISRGWRNVVRTQLQQHDPKHRNPCQEMPRQRLVRYDRLLTANEDPL